MLQLLGMPGQPSYLEKKLEVTWAVFSIDLKDKWSA
jgi:hypothetical protein